MNRIYSNLLYSLTMLCLRNVQSFNCRDGVVVERSLRMGEIVVRSPVGAVPIFTKVRRDSLRRRSYD